MPIKAINLRLLTIFVGCFILGCRTSKSETATAAPPEDPVAKKLQDRARSVLRSHGTGHYLTREAWLDLAYHFSDAELFEKSAALWRLIAQSREAALGPKSGKTADAYYELGLMLERSGRLNDAERALEHCVSMCPIKPGDGGLWLNYYGLLSYVQCKLGHWTKARQTCRLLLALQHTHLDTEAWAHRRLACALAGMKAFEQAKLEMELAMTCNSSWRSMDSIDGIKAHVDYARILRKGGKLKDSERILRSLLDNAGRIFQTDIPVILHICHELALCLAEQDKNAEAADYSQRACAGLDKWKEMEEWKSEFRSLHAKLLEARTAPSPLKLVEPKR